MQRLLIWIPLVFILVIHPMVTQNVDQEFLVFVNRGQQESDELIFVNRLTGDEVTIEVTGERYTIYGDTILYFNPQTHKMMIATSERDVYPHPFIQPADEFQRVHWVVSDDQTQIAWTLTDTNIDGQLITLTTVANLNGTNPRTILREVDTENNGLRALPVAFSEDNRILYMDAHPDVIDNYIAFNQYVGIFALDIETQEIIPLPEDRGVCICGADIDANLYLRLQLTENLQGFDLYVYNLAGDVYHVIPSLNLEYYDTGGEVLISPDGKKAVYALARIRNFGTVNQSIETIFILVDLQTMTQERLGQSITTFVRPIAWTENNSAIMLTSPTQNGTWKIDLTNKRLERITISTFVGTIELAQ